VLTLVFPHREAEHEADALAVWNGEGAVRLLAFVDETMEALLELSTSQDEQVLLHQDLHTVNVLAAERESWLVIDPKPLRGEREFSVAPIVRDYVLGARWWTIGQTVASMFESSQLHVHAETVQWLRAA
jgi:streptomycin 6-kinase